MTEALNKAITEVRIWERHWLLRQFGEDGQVLPENLQLFEYIETIIGAANPNRMMVHLKD